MTMEYRRLGRSGVRLSSIGLGSWLTFGGSVSGEKTAEVVREAWECGVRFFDTADIYSHGQAEKVLGLALREYPRNHYVVATKCFFPITGEPNDCGLSRKHIIESCDKSLSNLGLDAIDLFQCHRFDENVELPEIVRAMGDLIRLGKVHYWGVSMWTAPQIRELCQVADALNIPRPVSNQPAYNLLERSIEEDVVPASVELGLGQVVFSPLAQGLLTGKYCGGKRPAGSRAVDIQRNMFLKPRMTEESFRRAEALVNLADKLGYSAAQLALAWILHQPGITSAIVGATRPEQIRENAAAAAIRLSDEMLASLGDV